MQDKDLRKALHKYIVADIKNRSLKGNDQKGMRASQCLIYKMLENDDTVVVRKARRSCRSTATSRSFSAPAPGCTPAHCRRPPLPATTSCGFCGFCPLPVWERVDLVVACGAAPSHCRR